jgi:phosphoenolpyruvate carboxykinase (ATP)
MFGTILENVVLDPVTRKVRFEDQTITENTRASYPLHYIPNFEPSGRGGSSEERHLPHGGRVRRAAADSAAVAEQAMYYFLSGYTAKVAGTERGVTEPQATFSACFGAVFLVWPPTKYAEMLGERAAEARLAGMAGEHRLDRRPVRRRAQNEACPHPRDDPRRAAGEAGR